MYRMNEPLPEENKGGGCLSTSLVIGIIILCLVTTFYRPYSPGVIIRIIGFGDTRTILMVISIVCAISILIIAHQYGEFY